MKAKIKDIAAYAGVSTGTVDRVIHDRGRVSEDTRKKVKEAMKELRYKPDIVARTLAKKDDSILKILLPYPYQDFYWKMIREGIEQGLTEFAPYRLKGQTVFYDMNDPDHFELIAGQILEENPDVLFVGSEFYRQTIDLVKKCDQREIKCIVMNAEINSAPSLTYIGINSYVVGELAGRIIRNTRQRSSILVVHSTENIENTLHLKNKELGLIDALEKSEIPFRTERIVFSNQNSGDQCLNELTAKIEAHMIDTIYITTSRAYQYAPTLKRLYPQLYIIGHDLIDHNIRLLKQGTINLIIDQSGYRMGYLSIKSWVDHHILEKEIPRKQYLPIHIVYPENLPFYIKNRKTSNG